MIPLSGNAVGVQLIHRAVGKRVVFGGRVVVREMKWPNSSMCSRPFDPSRPSRMHILSTYSPIIFDKYEARPMPGGGS